jgi:hypothetical protein
MQRTDRSWTRETAYTVAERLRDTARSHFLEHGGHPSLAAVFARLDPNDGKDLHAVFFVDMPVPDAEEHAPDEGAIKDTNVDRVRLAAEQNRAVGVAFIGEAWRAEDRGTGQLPVDAPDRERILWFDFQTVEWGCATWIARVTDDGALGEWVRTDGPSQGRIRRLLPPRSIDLRDRDDEEARRLVDAARAALPHAEWKRVPGPLPDAPPDAVIVYDGFVDSSWTFVAARFLDCEPIGKARLEAENVEMILPADLAAEAFRLADGQVQKRRERNLG